jgi:hypothetical protein
MRDELPTLPYEMTPAELRARAKRLDEIGLTYLLLALDLRRMADAAEEAARPKLPALTEGDET